MDNSQEEHIDIFIRNVGSTFRVGCRLNLRQIASNGSNVQMCGNRVLMKIRKPGTTASIFASGSITVSGATSESTAKKAARRVARIVQIFNSKVRFHKYKVVNVLATCKMPWDIDLNRFSAKFGDQCSYEPELFAGLAFNSINPKSTMNIFHTGSVTCTAQSVDDARKAIEKVHPILYVFKKSRHKKRKRVVDEVSDSDQEFFFDSEAAPPHKKSKLQNSSNLPVPPGPTKIKKPRKALGKENDFDIDLMQVSSLDSDTTSDS